MANATAAMQRFGYDDGGPGATPARVGDHLMEVEARLRAAFATKDPDRLARALDDLGVLRLALVARGVLDLAQGEPAPTARHERCDSTRA